MKRLTSSLLTILFALTLFMNCAQSNSRSRRPVTSFQINPQKKSFKLGTEIQINLQTKLKEGLIERIDISVDGKQIQTSKILTNSFLFKTIDFGVGKHIVKVTATKTDGVSGENYEEIFVTSDRKPIQYGYEVVAVYPHDPKRFTQGLEFHNNVLYEGTGQETTSFIYQTDLKTGKNIKNYKLEDQYFGEGITILNNKIFELTYKNQIGFIYDLTTFKPLGTWKYKSKEGWGLTNDGQSLIMSDGTENIYFIHPDTFKEVKKIQVCNEYNIVKNINELEYIKGEIWANIWTTDNIVIIDPKTGKVTGEVNLSGLSGSIIQSQREQMDVLNGIAWNPVTDKIYVTGKLWPKLFEIKLIKKDN
ncbi:MAG: glutaminyl-peptide cyclotransferase [Prolixibacteraceae bacterium]